MQKIAGILMFVVFFGPGCGGDSGSPAADSGPEMGADAADEMPHDCVPYTPTEAGDTIAGSWSDADDSQVHTITVPDDPGGGYVTVTLVSDSADVPPNMIVKHADDDQGSIVGGGPPQGADPTTKDVAFEVAASQSYNLEAHQIGGLSAEEYPLGYTFTWEYHGLADCYEPNEEPGDAARIPLGLEIEASEIAGFLENSLANGQFVDWYQVTLSSSTVLRVETTSVPPNAKLRLRIFDDAGDQVIEASPLPELGGLVAAEAGPLDAGSYLIEVKRADEVKEVEDDEPLPDHFTTPYRMLATAPGG